MLTRSFNTDAFESFISLDGVMQLFRNESAVLAGWIHYLAFDLMEGVFIVLNSLKNNIPHLLVIPCLLLTFMLGPIGLLLYLFIRILSTRRYFISYP